MTTPDLQLQTAFVLDAERRIVSTREPEPTRGPLLSLVRSATSCAWAVRSDVPADVAGELDRLARTEPSSGDLRAAPVHAQRYVSVLAEFALPRSGVATVGPTAGPAFSFPERIPVSREVVVIESEALLEHHFRGWVPGEIEAGRAPVLAVLSDGYPVSVCFCARSSDAAAAAGLETAEAYRRRGFGARVTAAWASAIRQSGRIPLYNTSWTNHASLAVARALNLLPFASVWSLGGG